MQSVGVVLGSRWMVGRLLVGSERVVCGCRERLPNGFGDAGSAWVLRWAASS